MSTATRYHEPSERVFIVGMNNSGTTTLFGDLREHPQLSNSSYGSLLAQRGHAERIERVADKELSAHDYESNHPNSEARESPFDRLAGLWHDAKSSLVHLIKARAGAQRYLSCSLYWLRIKATAEAQAMKR